MVHTYQLFRAIILSLYSHIHPYDFSNSVSPLQEYDFIVVGSGAAGSVVAGRLAETDASVLVLEAGPSAFEQPETVIPATAPHIWHSNLKIFKVENSEYTKKYNIKVGHVIGGGTTVNSLVFTKGSKGDFDNWAKLGNSGWNYDSVLPYLRKLESFNGVPMAGNEHLYGYKGPIGVSERNKTNHFKGLLEAAAKEMGYSYIDSADPDKIGFMIPHENSKDGVRSSTSECYLKPLIERGNLLVKTDSLVTKLLFDEDNKIKGVEYVYEGETKQVMAVKEVIISAGAIASPKLLMLSGVGPAEDIKKLEIPVVADIPGVGRNLKEHPGGQDLRWFMQKNRFKQMDEAFIRENMKEYNATNSGPLTETRLPIGIISVNLNDPENPKWPDVFIQILPFAKYGFQLHAMLGRPKSSGHVKLRSANATDDPIVTMNVFDNPDDIKTMVKGLKFAHQVGNTAAIRNYFGLIFSKNIPSKCRTLNLEEFSESYWECFAKYDVKSYQHVAGTCKMAPESDTMGVVDSELRVRKVSGVRVVDASIMPQVVTINPTNSIIMIAEKAADMIKRQWNLTVSEPSLKNST